MKPVHFVTGWINRVRRSRVVPISPHTKLLGVTVRLILAAAVLTPTAALTIALGEPFAISAIASTVAIVMHAPQRYHQHPQLILSCYVAGIAVSATVSLAAALVGVAPLLAAAIAAVLIVASPAGRLHPPTACIPLQVIASIPPLALVGRWLTFTGLSLACLAVLWLLTAGPLARYSDADVAAVKAHCGAS